MWKRDEFGWTSRLNLSVHLVVWWDDFLRITLSSGQTGRLKPPSIHTRRTNGRFLTSKGSGTNKGIVVLSVIKIAAVACKVTKPEAASIGSKSFAFKIFCLSLLIRIQDGQIKTRWVVPLAYILDEQIVRRLVRRLVWIQPMSKCQTFHNIASTLRSFQNNIASCEHFGPINEDAPQWNNYRLLKSVWGPSGMFPLIGGPLAISRQLAWTTEIISVCRWKVWIFLWNLV